MRFYPQLDAIPRSQDPTACRSPVRYPICWGRTVVYKLILSRGGRGPSKIDGEFDLADRGTKPPTHFRLAFMLSNRDSREVSTCTFARYFAVLADSSWAATDDPDHAAQHFLALTLFLAQTQAARDHVEEGSSRLRV